MTLFKSVTKSMLRKIIIISGSKSDKLTKKVIELFDKNSIAYILIDYDNLSLFYSLNNKFINIKKNFSGADLIKCIEQLEKKIVLRRDCIFLFEFRSGTSKNIYEYKLSAYIRKKNYKRFFYNRRSFDLIYFITNDFYGLNRKSINHKQSSNKKINHFISKLLNAKKYKLKFDPVLKYSSKKKIFSIRNFVEILKATFYFIKFSNFLFTPKILNNNSKKKIFLIVPKNYNWFLSKSRSKFSSLENILPIITSLTPYYEFIICNHPHNYMTWFDYLLRFWNLKIVTSFYSQKSQHLIKSSDVIFTFGTSSVVESLLSSKPTLEIGKTPRVCNFQMGYIFLSEKNIDKDKISLKIKKLMNIKTKIIMKIPNFYSVYYPEHKNVNVGGKYGKSMVSNLEIDYLKNFFLKELKIK